MDECIKKYFRDSLEFEQFNVSLKLVPCPHLECRNIGFLIQHGRLMGMPENLHESQLSYRGHRYFCSNKKNRKGCGHTFSILWADCLRGFSVRAKTLSVALSRLVVMRDSKSSVSRTISFSRSTLQRWWRHFKKNQNRLRVILCRICDPPTLPSGASSLLELWEHLKTVCTGGLCLVSNFQLQFQKSFF